MKKTKDNFSVQANTYAQFRPVYPEALYAFIRSHCTHFDVAWDAACGNGQISRELVANFKHVIATDISEKQLESAPQLQHVTYRCERAESSSLPDHSVDLICVGQALHWFDFDAFFNEAKRVLKPDGVLACWGYANFQLQEELQTRMDTFYHTIVGPYWDPERRHVEEKYKSIEFPFKTQIRHEFNMSFQWPVTTLFGYLDSWSATQHYIRQNHKHPISEEDKNEWIKKWGNEQLVTFPLFLILCKN